MHLHILQHDKGVKIASAGNPTVDLTLFYFYSAQKTISFYIGGFGMKNGAYSPYVGKEKLVAIWTLYITSILIILIGVSYGIYSVVNNISLTVMSSQIPGAVFGVVVLFLGLRYFLSVKKLKATVYESTSTFSWSNFKKSKSKS